MRRKAEETGRLTVEIRRPVRFEETDALGIVWHGRFASWLEDGREALNARYGLSYLRFSDAGVLVPIRIFHVDYLRPLRYPHTYTIRTSLLWNEAARIDYEYAILDAQGTTMAEASTTQLMTTLKGDLLLDPPAFFIEFRNRWKNGEPV